MGYGPAAPPLATLYFRQWEWTYHWAPRTRPCSTRRSKVIGAPTFGAKSAAPALEFRHGRIPEGGSHDSVNDQFLGWPCGSRCHCHGPVPSLQARSPGREPEPVARRAPYELDASQALVFSLEEYHADLPVPVREVRRDVRACRASCRTCNRSSALPQVRQRKGSAHTHTLCGENIQKVVKSLQSLRSVPVAPCPDDGPRQGTYTSQERRTA